MSVFLSPGVYTREVDLSLFAPALSSTILGLVGVFTSGPINTPTFISDLDGFINTFGKPKAGTFGALAAIQYLRYGRQLQVVRVGASSSLAFATVNINDVNPIPAPRITVNGLYKGSSYNGWQAIISNASGSTFTLAVVDPSGIQREIYNGLIIVSSDPNYFVTRINNISSYITVADLNSSGTYLPATGTFTLINGNDGVTGLVASDITGTAGSGNGLDAFSNQETISINMLAAPDYTLLAASQWQGVINDMLSLCSGRGDAIAIIDPPPGATAQQVVSWHNGIGVTIGTNVFPSGALYWPWVEIFDPFNNVNVFVPPSGFVAATYANNDFLADPWFAPAGTNRGHLIEALAIERSPSQGDRDFIYSGGNAVNPIVNFIPEGITIYGQRTLQRTPTALDRVNVRRMLLYARKLIAIVARSIVFEPNDPKMWRSFTRLANNILDGIKAARGITDFKVIMDATTNTPDLISQNIAKAKLLIIPTQAAEIIEVDFTVLAAGTNFEEIVGSNG